MSKEIIDTLCCADIEKPTDQEIIQQQLQIASLKLEIIQQQQREIAPLKLEIIQQQREIAQLKLEIEVLECTLQGLIKRIECDGDEQTNKNN